MSLHEPITDPHGTTATAIVGSAGLEAIQTSLTRERRGEP